MLTIRTANLYFGVKEFLQSTFAPHALAILRTASSSVGPTGAHSSIKAEYSSSNSRRSSPGRIAVLANAPCLTACMLRKRILPRSNMGRSRLHAHRNQVAKAKGELYKLGKHRLTEISFLSNVFT